jgi:hypothetical protein
MEASKMIKNIWSDVSEGLQSDRKNLFYGFEWRKTGRLNLSDRSVALQNGRLN